MAETVTYAPVPEPRPRIGRDRTAVVLAVVAVLPIYLGMPLVVWLQGRLNVKGELPFMGTSCLAMLAYPIASIALLIRVLIRFLDGTAMQRVRWIRPCLCRWRNRPGRHVSPAQNPRKSMCSPTAVPSS